VNPSGGSLAIGNLIEASASHRLLEAVLQLRGEAAKMQVKGAKRALVQSWRGVPTATGGVAILSVGS
jgi:acetyl-CoA C-acetyltransferase